MLQLDDIINKVESTFDNSKKYTVQLKLVKFDERFTVQKSLCNSKVSIY